MIIKKWAFLHQWFFIALFIGFIDILLMGANAYGQTQDQSLDIENQSPASKKSSSSVLVTVEPPQLVPANCSCEFEPLPYRLRRQKWGKLFSVSYSLFKPIYYKPKFYSVNFKELYLSDDIPLIEASFTWKRNTIIGSLGGVFGIGIYKNKSDVFKMPSQLNVLPIQLGGIFALDTFSKEPLFVPYVSGGAYTMYYTEDASTDSIKGYTQVSFYATVGIMFQLNWIDRQAAIESYIESGIENTYLFIEGRKFFASSDAKDPNFETDLHGNAGLRIEF